MTTHVTQAFLARILKIDRSSVSLALRGSPRVSEETRRRVLELAARYNYRPHLAAQQLRSGAPKAIGLLMPAYLTSLAEPIVVATLQAMAQEVAAAGMVLSMVAVPTAGERPLLAAHLDGLLAWGDLPFANLMQYMPTGRSVVVIDPNDPSYAGAPVASVRMDNAGGAAAVVEHLIVRGAQRLLFVKAVEHHLGHEERWRGARMAWTDRRPVVSASCCTPADIADADLVSLANAGKSAIFCSHDGVAFDIWLRLARLGIRVPEEIMLAGFDGTPLAKRIGLTTAAPDCQALARAAVQGLLSLMCGKAEALSCPLIPVHLHTGGTT